MKQRLKLKTLPIMFFLVFLSFSSANASTVSTFDSGMDGWTCNSSGANCWWVSTDGNPGGYARIEDAAAGVGMWFYAPAKFTGDLSIYSGGTLSMDLRLIVVPNINDDPGYGLVTIKGAGLSASLDLVAGRAATSWRTYSAPLKADVWGVSDSDWNSILSDTSAISITIEAGANLDASGLDNFSVSAVPLPPSAWLFASFLMLLGPISTRKKFKRF